MATREQVERWLDDATGYRPILDTEDRPAIVAMADMLERAAEIMGDPECVNVGTAAWLRWAGWLAEWRGEADE